MRKICNAYDCKNYSHAYIDCSNEENRNKGMNKNVCNNYEAAERDADGLVVRSRCEFLGNICCSIDDCHRVEDMKRGNYYDCDSNDAFI